MANAEQIKALIHSHYEHDIERFETLSLQVAAYEATHGHGNLALDIRKLVEKGRTNKSFIKFVAPANLEGLMLTSEPDNTLNELVVSVELHKRIERILLEYRQKAKLKKHNMSHRRKILLVGPPGTGKTLTASVVARELHLPLSTILVDKLVTKFMGETTAKLRQIFDMIAATCGVYLFDEFDAIGSERTMDNDVGEMRRVLNSFLQYIEQDQSNSLIIAATNNPGMLDSALFRRFDDVISFEMPKKEDIKTLILNRLGTFKGTKMSMKNVMNKALGLSHAEVTRACDDAIKHVILDGKKQVSGQLICQMLTDRHAVYDATYRKPVQ